jgi:hypothetical protein
VENKNKSANAFASTFAIFPVPAYSPIAKELTKSPLFCLLGNLVILPKKTKTILYFVLTFYQPDNTRHTASL